MKEAYDRCLLLVVWSSFDSLPQTSNHIKLLHRLRQSSVTLKMSSKAPLAMLIVAIVAIASTQAALTVPDVLASNARYFVINDRTGTFWEAFRYCNSLGLQLASVHSASDTAALVAAMKAATPKSTLQAWWSAGTDLGKQGEFVWISTLNKLGFKTGYTNFYPGEPNNEFGNEHCIELYSTGQWNDKNCDAKKNYICEKPM